MNLRPPNLILSIFFLKGERIAGKEGAVKVGDESRSSVALVVNLPFRERDRKREEEKTLLGPSRCVLDEDYVSIMASDLSQRRRGGGEKNPGTGAARGAYANGSV